MSNCIEVHSTMAMPIAAIDVDRLFRDIAKYNVLAEAPTNKHHAYIIWWFLGLDNVYTDDKHLFINLGDHRSIHTFRDVQQTLNVLACYMYDNAQRVVLIQSDETDGFDKQYKATYDLEVA